MEAGIVTSSNHMLARIGWQCCLLKYISPYFPGDHSIPNFVAQVAHLSWAIWSSSMVRLTDGATVSRVVSFGDIY